MKFPEKIKTCQRLLRRLVLLFFCHTLAMKFRFELTLDSAGLAFLIFLLFFRKTQVILFKLTFLLAFFATERYVSSVRDWIGSMKPKVTE